MAKLNEMNGWELMAALAELAEPISNLVNDDALWECFVVCTKRGIGLERKDVLRFLLQTYGKMIPLLTGEEHRGDVLRIMAVVEGTTVDKAMKMNGKELLRDFVAAYKEHLEPFFTKSARLGAIV